jgi:phosphoribosyl-ATP pyrophosphohydrolase/phosphoribosyl-AMP cyclohydrolase/histidinol dehydrogenase
MAGRFMVSIDFRKLQGPPENGVDWKTLSYLNSVLITVVPETYQDASAFLRLHSNSSIIYCDCTALESLDDIVSLLNCGATKVFLAYWNFKAIVEDRLLVGQDLSRLIVSFDHSVCEGDPEDRAKSILSKIKSFVSDVPIGIQVHDVHNWKLLDIMHQMSKSGGYPERYVILAYNTRDHYMRAVRDGHVAIVPSNEITTDPKKYPHLLPAHLLITTAIHSDRPDGLFPTVVTDEHGVCLGLVYSNEKSIEVALQSGCGVYHSRSRNGLWIKGQESGNTQELISISMDCDADALNFKVRQRGEGEHVYS